MRRRMGKRTCAILLAVCLIAGLFVVPASAATTTYTLTAEDVGTNPTATDQSAKFGTDSYFAVNKLSTIEAKGVNAYGTEGAADYFAPTEAMKVGKIGSSANAYSTSAKSIYFTTKYDNAVVSVWWNPASNGGRYLVAIDANGTSLRASDAATTSTSDTTYKETFTIATAGTTCMLAGCSNGDIYISKVEVVETKPEVEGKTSDPVFTADGDVYTMTTKGDTTTETATFTLSEAPSAETTYKLYDTAEATTALAETTVTSGTAVTFTSITPAIAAGTYYVTATKGTDSESDKVAVTVQVFQVAATSVAFSDNTALTMTVGDEAVTRTLTVLPADTTDTVEVTNRLATVATYDKDTGAVAPAAIGQTTVSATAGSLSDSFTVTVNGANETQGTTKHIFDAANLAVGPYTAAADVAYNDFFTVHFANGSAVTADANQVFGTANDPWNFTTTNFFAPGANGTITSASVSFETTAVSTVEVWWKQNTGSAQRNIKLGDESGDGTLVTTLIGTENFHGTTSDTDPKMTNGTLYHAAFTNVAAGKHYVAAADGGTEYIYRVVVDETPVSTEPTATETAISNLTTAAESDGELTVTTVEGVTTVSIKADDTAVQNVTISRDADTGLTDYVKGLLEAKLNDSNVTVAVTSATWVNDADPPAVTSAVTGTTELGKITYAATLTAVADNNDVANISGEVTVMTTPAGPAASAATIRVATAEEYTACFGSWAGKPATLADMQALTIAVDAQNDKLYKATGTVKYNTGFTGFDAGNEAAQEGNYICFLVLDAVTGDVTGGTITLKDNNYGTGDLVFDNLSGSDAEGDEAGIINVNRVGNANGETATTITIVVDWDGNGEAYEATTYTLDLSGVTFEPKPDTNVTGKVSKANVGVYSDQTKLDESETLAPGYTVTENVNAETKTTTVTVTADAVVKHPNSKNTEAYWLGFGIQNAAQKTYKFMAGKDADNLTEWPAAAGRYQDVEETQGQPAVKYNTVYFDLENDVTVAADGARTGVVEQYDSTGANLLWTYSVTFTAPLQKASAADFAALTSAQYDLFTWEGKPAYADVSGIGYAADQTTPTTIKVTGTIPYTEGFTGFNTSVAAEQEGNYIAFSLLAPESAGTITAGKVTLVKGQGGTDDKVYENLTGDAGDPAGLLLIIRVRTGENAEPHQFTVDWDGDGKAFTPTTYTLDFSGAQLGTKGQQTSTASFAALTSEQYALFTWEGKPAYDAVKDVTYTAEGTTIKVGGAIAYTEGFTGFNSTVPAEQEGNYIAFSLLAPAADITAGKVVIVNGEGGASDKTYTGLTGDATDPAGLLLIIRVRENNATNKHQFTVDWDGDGDTYLPTTYTLDFSGATLAKKTYDITKTDVAAESTGCSFTVKVGEAEVTEAAAGDTVVVTPAAGTGFVVDKVTWQAAGAESATELTAAEGVYSFTMPAAAVTVTVTFAAEQITPPVDTKVHEFTADALMTKLGQYDTTANYTHSTTGPYEYDDYFTVIPRWSNGAYEGMQLRLTTSIVSGATPTWTDYTPKWALRSDHGGNKTAEVDTTAEDGVKEFLSNVIQFTVTEAPAKVEVWFIEKSAKGVALYEAHNPYALVKADITDTTAGAGGMVTLYAPVAGTYYLGGCDANGNGEKINPVKVVVTEAAEVAAADTLYTVSVAATTNGRVAVMPEYAKAGDTVTVTPTAAAGYELGAVTVQDADNGSVTVTDGKFTMPAKAVTVTVTFKAETPAPATEYTITKAAATNGSFTVSAEKAAAGTEITVTTTPADGYALDAITVTDADNGPVTVTDGKFTMPAKAVTVTVTFKTETPAPATEYTITKAAATNGFFTVSAEKAAAGTEITVTTTPADGYALDAITVTDADNGSVTVTDGKFTMPAKAVTVTVTFKTETVEPTPDKTIVYTPENVTAVYDGQAHNIKVTVTEPADATVTLSDETGITDVGSKEITYTITAEGYTTVTGKATVTVTKADVALAVEADKESVHSATEADRVVTFTVTPAGFEATITCDKNVTVTGGKATLPDATETYTFTATYAGDANHNGATATVKVYATKSDEVDKSALRKAIDSAGAKLEGVQSSADGKDVVIGETWATPEDIKTLTDAIEAAQAVVDDDTKTADDVAAAVTTLTAAADAFTPAAGTKTADKTALAAAIDKAEKALADATRTEDGSTVAKTATWVSAANANEVQAAIDAATAVNEDATASQDDVDAAVSALNKVLELIQAGTKSSGSSGGRSYNTSGSTTPTDTTTTKTLPDGSTVKTTTAADGSVTATVTLGRGVEETTVSVAVPNVDSGLVPVLVKADGTEEIIRDSAVIDDQVVFTLGESGTVKIVNNAKEFVDVPGHWAEPEVDFVSARELFNGVDATHFAPDATMTRGMMATVLFRLDGETKAAESVNFSDVVAGEWYADAVDWAAEANVINGYEDGSFGPTKSITRQELVVMIYRYAGQPAATGEGDMSAFSDAGSVSDWAEAAMLWAIENGIIKGRGDGTLDPQGNATRAEVSAVLARYVALAKQ